MEISYHSIIDSGSMQEDLRVIECGVKFYMLDKNEVESLGMECARWILAKLSPYGVERWFVHTTNMERPKWRITSVRQAKLEKIMDAIQASGFDFAVDGCFVSDRVYNGKSLNEYWNYLNQHATFHIAPLDYQRYFLEHFSDPNIEPEVLKKELLALFHAPGRRWRGCGELCSEYGGFFISFPYDNFPDKYRGTFRCSVNAGCIQIGADAFAEELVELVTDFSRRYHNLNAYVRCDSCSGETSHRRYFANRVDAERTGAHLRANCSAAEFYPSYFLEGVEWFNLIGPRAAHHLPDLAAKDSPEMQIQRLPWGSWCARAKTGILNVDVTDLIPIKRVLYPALYPGHHTFGREIQMDPKIFTTGQKLRSMWEQVPVFPEELTVTDTEIIFCHPVMEDDGVIV